MLLLVVENKMHCGIKQYIILLSKYKFNCICTCNRYSLLKWIKQILIYSHKSSLNFPSSYSPNTIMIPLSHLPLSLKKKTIKRTNKIKVRYQKAPPLEKKTEIKQTHNETKPEVHFLLGCYTWGWSLIWSMVDELCDILPPSVCQCLIIYAEILGSWGRCLIMHSIKGGRGCVFSYIQIQGWMFQSLWLCTLPCIFFCLKYCLLERCSLVRTEQCPDVW